MMNLDSCYPIFLLGSYEKHQYIVLQGNPVPYVHFVVKGLLKSFYIDKSGKNHILQFAMEDRWITDNQGFYNNQNATLNIDCQLIFKTVSCYFLRT